MDDNFNSSDSINPPLFVRSSIIQLLVILYRLLGDALSPTVSDVDLLLSLEKLSLLLVVSRCFLLFEKLCPSAASHVPVWADHR